MPTSAARVLSTSECMSRPGGKQLLLEGRVPHTHAYFPLLSLPDGLLDRVAGSLPASSRASLTYVCKELHKHLPEALQQWDNNTRLSLWEKQTTEVASVAQECQKLEAGSREVLLQLSIGEKTDDPGLYKKVLHLLQQAEEGSRAAIVLAGVRVLKIEVLPDRDEYAPDDVAELGALISRKLPRMKRLELCCRDLNFCSLMLRAMGTAHPCLQELVMSGVKESKEGWYNKRELTASRPLPSLSLCLTRLRLLRLCVTGSFRMLSEHTALNELKRLETLEIDHLPPEALKTPHALESLRKLKVGYFRDACFGSMLAVCPNVEFLEVGHLGIGAASRKRPAASRHGPLMSSPSLRCFKLHECSLRHLPTLMSMHTPKLQQCIISLVDTCISPHEVPKLQEAFFKELPPQALTSFPITWSAKVCAWRGSPAGTFTLLKDFVACMRVIQNSTVTKGLRSLELQNVQVADGDFTDLGALFPHLERLQLSSDIGCCYGPSKLMEAVTSPHLQHLQGLTLNGSMEDIADKIILGLCQAALNLRKDGHRSRSFLLFVDHRGGSRRGYKLKELPLEWRRTMAALEPGKCPNVQLITQVFETCKEKPCTWEPIKVASADQSGFKLSPQPHQSGFKLSPMASS